MPHPELAHLELLAEVDSLAEALQRWAEAAPDWTPGRACRALVRRLSERARAIRVRLQAPLVVATLGGSGTGKSALVNALVGDEVVQTGRYRPTTRRPVMVCRHDVTPELLGIDPASVELVHRDAPTLADLVLVDCPDPDTTEEPELAGSNLARLRQILPHCDVLLVASTQQKYRSARVADELAAAAAGARLVFVQTHADSDQDIRDDWRQVLGEHYATGHIFLIDSLGALADAQQGLTPRGDFAGLLDLLTRQLAGAAAARIRRANLVDLAEETLATCRERLESALPAVSRLEESLDVQRGRLAARLAEQMRAELLANRRQWENRLLGQVASRWGLSPFALVLRVYQGVGSLFSGALLLRARTPAQVALWGAMEGARAWRRLASQRRAGGAASRVAAECWAPDELRGAAMVVEGYAVEAGLPRGTAGVETLSAEAAAAAETFAAQVGGQLDALLARSAQRHSGLLTRIRYEFLLLLLVGLLLYRLGRNFFYDSWLAPVPVAPHGLDFYIAAAFWLALWCLVLLWAFTSRLRRGLRSEIGQLSENWNQSQSLAGAFGGLSAECRRIEQFHQELERLAQQVAALRTRLTQPDDLLGHRR